MKRLLIAFTVLASALIPSAASAATNATLSPSQDYTHPNGGNVTFTADLAGYPANTTTIGVSVDLPAGWSYVNGTDEPDIKPTAGQITTVEWAYVSVPAGSTSFTFTVSYPEGIETTQSITSSVIVRNGGAPETVTPAEVQLAPATPPDITNEESASGTYGAPFSLSVAATSDIAISAFGATGLPDGLSFNTTTGEITGTPTQVGAFDIELNATNAAGTGAVQITLTIGKAAATVSLSDLATTYDGTPKAVSAITDPIGRTVAFTYDGSATAPTNAGSYTVVATIVDANYQGTQEGTFVINKAGTSVTWASPSAITYGTRLSAAQLNASASVAGSFVYAPAADTLLGAGADQALGVTFTPTDTANYTPSTSAVSITVNKAVLEVAANYANRNYGSPNPSFTPSFTGFMNGETSAVLAGTPSLTTAALTSSDVGSYPIIVTIGTLAAENYSFTFTDGTLTINKAVLSVAANSASKLLGLENPSFTASITGYVNGEDASVLSGAPSLTTAATASSPTGNYPIVAAIGNLAADNYSFSFTNGTLSIELGFHSADVDHNWRLSLFEVTRVIDLYNTLDGALRTGDYHAQDATEDGFAPGVGDLTYYHMADADFDGRIDLLELTRVIQLFNTVEASVRTGAYHLDPESEDGFAPGSN